MEILASLSNKTNVRLNSSSETLLSGSLFLISTISILGFEFSFFVYVCATQTNVCLCCTYVCIPKHKRVRKLLHFINFQINDLFLLALFMQCYTGRAVLPVIYSSTSLIAIALSEYNSTVPMFSLFSYCLQLDYFWFFPSMKYYFYYLKKPNRKIVWIGRGKTPLSLQLFSFIMN